MVLTDHNILNVRQFLYPAFISQSTPLLFTDQYAFCPTGSITAALISTFATITSLLACNDYVVVVALDFSKAFDTVRHATLLAKMAQINLPDIVFNWLVDYFRGHEHCTRYNGAMSTMLPITMLPALCHVHCRSQQNRHTARSFLASVR